METVRTNPDGSTDNATSNTWYDANGFVSNTTQIQNGDINNPSQPFNRAFVNDAQGHAVYVNQGAEAGGNSTNPKIDTAVNGRIQNKNLDGTGYEGGWIGNRTTNPGHVQHQMVVAGEVLARYGDAADKSAGAGAAPAFAPVAELYLSAPGSALHEGNADPVAHTVVGGETLQSIARSTLGDSRLWYRIAQANGLSVQPDKPLQAGLTLSIPKATLSANSASTFKPYDPSRVIGDTNPALNALPVPQADDGGCGGFGQILVLAIIIAATIYSAGALAASGAFGTSAAATAASASGIAVSTGASTLGATFAAGGAVLGGGAGIGTAIAAGAVSSAIGSVAGQTFGIATGMQQDFDWRSVGLAALSGGVSAGLAGFAPLGGDASPFANLVARAAVGSALTQGVAVAIGLQRSFSWTSVAASAIGAGVGYGVSTAVGQTDISPFGQRAITSFAAGTATSLARGGRVSIQQIAVDAFGSAIGNSFVDNTRNAGTQEDRLTSLYNDGDIGRSELRLNPNAPSYNFATNDGFDSGFAGTFGTALPRDSSNDVMVADARDKLKLNVDSDSDENFYSNIIGRHQASEAQRQAARAASDRRSAQMASNLYASGAGDVRGPVYSTPASGYPSASFDAVDMVGAHLPSMFAEPQVVRSGFTSDGLPFSEYDSGASSFGLLSLSQLVGSPMEFLATGGTGLRLPASTSGPFERILTGAANAFAEPFRVVGDLGKSVYGLASNTPGLELTSQMARSSATGATQGELIRDAVIGGAAVNPFIGMPLATFGLVKSAINGDYEGVGANLMGLGGSASMFKATRWGETGLIPSQSTTLGFRERGAVTSDMLTMGMLNEVDLGFGKVGPTNFTEMYRTRPAFEVAALRNEFGGLKPNFLREYAASPEGMARYERGEFSQTQFDKIKNGEVPRDFEIHHKLPLFRGGDNSFGNFDLLPKSYHRDNFNLLHNYAPGKNPYGLDLTQ